MLSEREKEICQVYLKSGGNLKIAAFNLSVSCQRVRVVALKAGLHSKRKSLIERTITKDQFVAACEKAISVSETARILDITTKQACRLECYYNHDLPRSYIHGN